VMNFRVLAPRNSLVSKYERNSESARASWCAADLNEAQIEWARHSATEAYYTLYAGENVSCESVMLLMGVPREVSQRVKPKKDKLLIPAVYSPRSLSL
jgi:hypothetical protein